MVKCKRQRIKSLCDNKTIIDSGYRSEWFVPITNTTNTPIVISKGTSLKDVFGNICPNGVVVYPYNKAIAQALVVPVPTVDVEEYTYDELKMIPSDRRNGALGSSGK